MKPCIAAYGLPTDLTGIVATERPTITSITPATGSYTGGTSVVIAGTSFTSATRVEFVYQYTHPSLSFVVDSDLQITATTPAEAAGRLYGVRVMTPGGIAFLDAAFLYIVVAPNITLVSPASGPDTGGTEITIDGSGFTGATLVRFLRDGVYTSLSYTVNSDAEISATTPAELAGRTYDVVVTAPGGVASYESAFTYAEAATPVLDALALTLNCRPGDVLVTGPGSADYVEWTSRASAGSSGTNSLYRLNNAGTVKNATGTLNGKSTLIIPHAGVDSQVRLTAYNAAKTAQRTANYIIGTVGVNPSNNFTIALLCKFSNNSDTSLSYLCGMPNNISSMSRASGTKARANQYFGTVDATLRSAGTWQVLWMKLDFGAPVTGIAVNDDTYTTFAPSTAAYGVDSNTFIVGPQGTVFSTCDFEVGGVWATNLVLSSVTRAAIMAELRAFTGEALA